MFAAGLKENRCERGGIENWLGEPLSMALHHFEGSNVAANPRIGATRLTLTAYIAVNVSRVVQRRSRWPRRPLPRHDQ